MPLTTTTSPNFPIHDNRHLFGLIVMHTKKPFLHQRSRQRMAVPQKLLRSSATLVAIKKTPCAHIRQHACIGSPNLIFTSMSPWCDRLSAQHAIRWRRKCRPEWASSESRRVDSPAILVKLDSTHWPLLPVYSCPPC